MSRPRFPQQPRDVIGRPGATNHAAFPDQPRRVAALERARRAAPPNAKVTIRSGPGSVQAIAAGLEWVDWNTTVHNNGCTIDTSGGDNSATNYIRVPTSGLYLVAARVTLNAAAAARISAQLYNRGTGQILDEDLAYTNGGTEHTVSLATQLLLTAGDELAVKAGAYGATSFVYGELLATGDRLNHFELCLLAPATT